MIEERSVLARDPSSPGWIARSGRISVPGVPLPLTSLIGREGAVRAVTALLHNPDVRLVTLTGPGGIGKTRLAIAVAQDIGGDAAFVSLAAIAQPELIATAILQALGIEQTSSLPIEQFLHGALRERHLLLILDNFEHLLAGAPLVSNLLGNAAHVKVLATSQTRLGLSGEHIIPVQPLETPSPRRLPALSEAAEASGVRLFVERARAAYPTFTLTESNAAAIVTICERLDGLPLAIELAAARSSMLSPQALAARLEHRLELLAGGPRDAPKRLKTMRAALGWSIGLLGEPDRAFWERLGVFTGGFTAEAAEAIGSIAEDPVPAPLDTLASLIDHGLLRPAVNAEGEPRFAMLETAREYALERLAAHGVEGAVRDAHARCFVAFARSVEPGLMSAQSEIWFHRVEADIANVRTALGWLQEHNEIQPALELAGSLAWFWTAPNYIAEGRAWYDALLDAAGPDVDPSVLAKAYMAAGDLADWHADTDRAIALHERALAHWRDAGDRRGAAATLRSLGSAAIDRFAFDEAVDLLAEAYALSQQTGDEWNVAAAANLLGVATKELGHDRDAIRWHEDALQRWQNLGDRSHFPMALNGLGWCYLDTGQYLRAWEYFETTLTLTRDSEPNPDAAWTLVGFAALAKQAGDTATAARLLAAGMHQRQELGIPLRPPIRQRVDRLTNDLQATLGGAAFARAWAEGQSLTVAESETMSRAISIPGTNSGANLSHRERDVLLLLVEGASDHEIAKQLFITRRTASKHVAAILEKLGAPNRTAAATIAHRRGLV